MGLCLFLRNGLGPDPTGPEPCTCTRAGPGSRPRATTRSNARTTAVTDA